MNPFNLMLGLGVAHLIQSVNKWMEAEEMRTILVAYRDLGRSG